MTPSREKDQDEQPVVGERALSTYAHRFLFIWGALSVLAFALSALLTAVLAKVPSLEAPYNPVGMYGDYHGNAVGWVYYYNTSVGGGRYLVYYPTGTKFVALPYGKFTGCSNVKPTRSTLPASAVSTSQYQGHRYYLVRLFERKNGSPYDGEATCTIGFRATRDSFIGYSMDYWFLPTPPSGAVAATILNFSDTIDGAANMQVFGAKSTSSSGAALGPDDETVIRYTDERRESLRDIMLVVIGALVAIGASTALEAIRPYVEVFAAGRKR